MAKVIRLAEKAEKIINLVIEHVKNESGIDINESQAVEFLYNKTKDFFITNKEKK